MRDVEALREAVTGDILILLAAVHCDDVREKTEYQSIIVDVEENVVLVCHAKDVDRIGFTNTVAVYGFVEFETDETETINPFNECGWIKFQAVDKLSRWQVPKKTNQ